MSSDGKTSVLSCIGSVKKTEATRESTWYLYKTKKNRTIPMWKGSVHCCMTKTAQQQQTFLRTLLARIPKKGAAGKTQTRIHGAAETSHKDRVAQSGWKQGKVQEPPRADESAVCGVRWLWVFDKEDPRLCPKRTGNDKNHSPWTLWLFISNHEKWRTDARTSRVSRRRRSVPVFGKSVVACRIYEVGVSRQEANRNDKRELDKVQHHNRMSHLQWKPGKGWLQRRIWHVWPRHRRILRSRPQKLLL